MVHFALDWLDYISLFFIIFMGVPHGAMDGAISVTLGFTKSFHLQVRFIITYLLIALLVVVLWYFLPVFSLLIFLLISIFHFGCGDLNWKNNRFYYISGYVHGGLVVLGIIFFNKDEVDNLFSILSGNQLYLLWQFLYVALIVWVLSLIYLLFNHKKIVITKNYIKLLSLIVLVISLLPPLPAFAIYFCSIHSTNHIKRIIPTLLSFMEKKKILYLMIIFSVLSWLGGGLAYYILLNLNSYTDTIIKVTFIGLAALTFPHMILVDGVFRLKYEV